jgi:two-component system, NarL family, nitrate/nitrite response regulator NarL
MGREIRILLVDDHSLFRESLSRLLEAEPDLRIAGNCSNVTEALAILDREPVDLVLLDYDLGEQEGSLFFEALKSRTLNCRVLMVTAGMSDSGTLRALEGGAAGIFLKHSPPSQLVEAIYRVMRGEMWLDPRAVRSLVAGVSGKSEEQRTMQPLTAREQAVLRGVFEGFSNKEIGARLQISEGSVKAVMQQLFDKTGVRTRSQLVRIALENLAQDWRTETES